MALLGRRGEEFLYELKAGPEGGLRPPSGPAATTITGEPASPSSPAPRLTQGSTNSPSADDPD
jgi:hypothetical protein